MERRLRVRLAELLDDAEVHPGLLRGVLSSLGSFVEALRMPEKQISARRYFHGLLCDLDSR
jgi:hypothetical protein